MRHIFLITTLFFLFGPTYAQDMCDFPKVEKSGCGCDRSTYLEEVGVARDLLEKTLDGTHPKSEATTLLWGANPCQRSWSLWTDKRYTQPFVRDYERCKHVCRPRPWDRNLQSIKGCVELGKVSLCRPARNGGSMQDVQNDQAISYCYQYGMDIYSCSKAINCELSSIARSEKECKESELNFIWHQASGISGCYANSCSSMFPCSEDDRKKCTVNCQDCQALTKNVLDTYAFKCFDVQAIDSYNVGKDSTGFLAHSTIRLNPKRGSYAELMAPKGIFSDAWNSTNLKRVTECRNPKPGDLDKGNYMKFKFSKIRENDFQTLYEMIPFQLSKQESLELSSGCEIYRSMDHKSILSLAEECLHPSYETARMKYCRGSAKAEYDQLVEKIENTEIE